MCLRIVLAISASAGFFLSPGVFAVEAKIQTEGVKVLTDPVPWSSHWTALADADGGRVLVWYGKQPALSVMKADGSIMTLVGADDADQAPSGLAVATDPNGVWVAYRNKEPERDVYLTRTGAQPLGPVGVSGNTMALARLRLHASGSGVDAFWYGERSAENTLYNIFHRRLDAAGAPQGDAPELLLPGIYPVTLQDAEGNLGVVSWVKDDTGSRILARSRKADGDTFSEPVLVRETSPDVTIPFDAFVSGARWFVQWVAQYGEGKDEYLIEGAWSDDQGATWVPYDIESLRGWGVESQSFSGNGKEIVMAFSLANKASPRPEYRDVRIVRSVDNGATWLAPEKVRDEASEYAIARSPRVAFLDRSRVLLAWEDWREIRGRVRYSVSEDGGRSWAVRDARLPMRAESNVIMNMFANAIVPDGNGGGEIVVEELTDLFLNKQLMGVRLDANTLLEPAAVPAVELGNLRDKVEAYWTALQNEDYKAAYDQLDPFYRARVEYPEYLSTMGRIKFHEVDVGEIKLEGNIAHVALSLTAEVKPFFSQGKLVEVPKHSREVVLKWLSIDGEWFHEYFSEARQMRFTRY